MQGYRVSASRRAESIFRYNRRAAASVGHGFWNPFFVRRFTISYPPETAQV